MSAIEELKFNLRESEYPYFSDEQIESLLHKNNGDIEGASYEGLIIKSEVTGLNVSGLTTQDSSKYFKMLASKYLKTNSGIL